MAASSSRLSGESMNPAGSPPITRTPWSPAQVMNQGAAARVSGHDHFDAVAGQNANGRLVDCGGDDRTHAAAEQPYPGFTWSDRGEQAPPLRAL